MGFKLLGGFGIQCSGVWGTRGLFWGFRLCGICRSLGTRLLRDRRHAFRVSSSIFVEGLVELRMQVLVLASILASSPFVVCEWCRSVV